MGTVTKSRPVSKSCGVSGSRLTITLGKLCVDYLVEALASDFGRAFRLHKLVPVVDDHGTRFAEAEVYDVLLDGARPSCECLGFLHHGKCKHIDAATALLAAGKLPPAPASAPAAPAIADHDPFARLNPAA